MKQKEDRFVNMEHVIGQWAVDYNIPVLRFDQLVELGRRAVTVYNLHDYSKRIPFAELCEYIIKFIRTPFGENMLKNLSRESY
jgi:hypothetical protein